MRRTIHPIQIALVMSLAVFSAAPAAPGQERSSRFIEFVASVDRSEPIDRKAVERLVGGELRCSGSTYLYCDLRDLNLGAVKVGHLNFRKTGHGSILILGELSGECVPVAALQRRFGLGRLSQGCTDGHTCFYWETKRPWGSLRIGVRDTPPADCATDVVLDTLP